MPQPISNTTTIVSGSLLANQISYVVDGQGRNYRGGFDGLSWMSEVPAENNVIFIGNTTSIGRGPVDSPLFYSTFNNTEANVIYAVNNLPGSPGNLLTLTGAYDWAATNNFFINNSNNPIPRINADGMVLYVDANQLTSYPTTGTSWYDMSGNANNGTLINSPTWDSEGVMVFDGVDDRVDLVFNNRLNSFSGSLEAVVERKGTTSNSFLFGGVAASSNRFYIRQNSPTTYDAARGNPLSSSQFGTLDLDRYYHLVVTWDPSNLYTYKNGILFDSNTYTNPGTELAAADI